MDWEKLGNRDWNRPNCISRSKGIVWTEGGNGTGFIASHIRMLPSRCMEHTRWRSLCLSIFALMPEMDLDRMGGGATLRSRDGERVPLRTNPGRCSNRTGLSATRVG